MSRKRETARNCRVPLGFAASAPFGRSDVRSLRCEAIQGGRGLRQYVRSSRACRTPCICAARATANVGKIVFQPQQNIAVGDTIRLEYTAPPGLFKNDGDELVFWAGGFRGWTGAEEDETLFFPLMSLGDGRYRVSVCVPDFAQSVNFGFCDLSGFKWDTNGGKMYSIPVKYQKRVKEDGTVEDFVASEDSDVNSEYDRDLARKSASSPVISAEEEDTLHRIRGEATLVGEEAGLGAVFISEVRDMFTRYDVDRKGTVPVKAIPEMLKALSFDLEEVQVSSLIAKYVKRQDICEMTEFMSLYADLELQDEGLEIV